VLAYGCSASAGGLFELLVLLLVFAIGVPWNIAAYVLVGGVGTLAIDIPLPMACYRGHPPPTGDWALAEKLFILSITTGGFFNGCILAWMIARPKALKKEVVPESQRPNS
jgi:hypothetical protein